MGNRNALYRRSVEMLVGEEGMDSVEASDAVLQALDRRGGGRRKGRPGANGEECFTFSHSD